MEIKVTIPDDVARTLEETTGTPNESLRCPYRVTVRPRTRPGAGHPSSLGKVTSRADWQFVLIAADRGLTADEITAELLRVSEKVMKDSKMYAERTAQRAERIIASPRFLEDG